MSAESILGSRPRLTVVSSLALFAMTGAWVFWNREQPAFSILPATSQHRAGVAAGESVIWKFAVRAENEAVQLNLDGKSCSCLGTHIGSESLQPGEETEVVIETAMPREGAMKGEVTLTIATELTTTRRFLRFSATPRVDIGLTIAPSQVTLSADDWKETSRATVDALVIFEEDRQEFSAKIASSGVEVAIVKQSEWRGIGSRRFSCTVELEVTPAAKESAVLTCKLAIVDEDWEATLRFERVR